MSEAKTKKTAKSVDTFIEGVEPERQEDCRIILEMMRDITGEEPAIWGTSIIGFGRYHYKYASGHEGDSFLTGYSPRKQALTIYIMTGFSQYQALLDKLGRYKTGKSCLYLKKLADVDLAILRKLVQESVATMTRKYK